MTTRFAAHHRDPQPPLPHLIANRTSIAWSPLTTASSSGRSEWLFGRFVFRTRPASDVVSATMVSSRSAGVTTLSAHSDKNCASTPARG